MKDDFQRYLEEQLQDPEFRELWEEDESERQIQRALIDARIEQDMTQQQLAEATGMNQRVISRIESGNCNTTFKTLQRLAKGLNKKLVIEFVDKAS